MTYSLDHVADDQRLTDRLDTLVREVDELRRLLDMCDAVSDMRGRRPAADPERAGRQATHGPSRPTEDLALDHARSLMKAQIPTGITYVTYAIAYVRGVNAAMDRALSVWEGE